MSNIIVIGANIVLMVVLVFYSIILHEMAHGFAAYKFGDETAKQANRITLNPIPHIDLLGTVILPVGLLILGMPIFGWAKPVPINPANFPREKMRKALAVVSVAGVTVNFILAFVMFAVFAIITKTGTSTFSAMRIVECDVFPCPTIFAQVAGLNLMLMIFNLLPFPPLDGYNLVTSLAPEKISRFLIKNRNILMGVSVLLLVTGWYRYIFYPIYNLIIGLFLKIFNL